MQATAVIPASVTSTRIWYRLALLYFVAGTGLGVFMGVSQDHTMFPVHAHLNLLGWASLALTGFIYDRFPAAAASRLSGAFLAVQPRAAGGDARADVALQGQ
jgi:hypothetical protein